MPGVAFCAILRGMNLAPTLRAVSPGQVVRLEFSLAEAAQACEVDESTVWRWAQKTPKGTGGIVPSRYHFTLLQLAHQLGRKLTADDLVLGRHGD